MMLFRALVLRYVAAHRVRALMTVFAVATGVAVTFAIDVANATAIASFSSSVNVIANRVNLQVLGVGRGFDERLLLRVEREPDVESAQPVVEGEVALEGGTEILHVLGMDVTRAQATPDAGRQPLDLDAFINRRGIILSERVARARGLRAGSVLRGFVGPHRVAFTVAAIAPATASADSGVAFVDIATAQETFDRVGRLDRIDVIADSQRLARVRDDLAKIVPLPARTIEPRVRTSEIGSMLRSFQLNLTALGFVALVVAMYLTYNAVAIAVVQRRAEIGTLRAMGAPRRTIFTLFLGEGALYGVAGSALGILAGALLARYSVAAETQTVSSLFVGSHADAPVFSAASVVKACVAGIAAATLSAVAPALDAASTPPARTMRGLPGYERARAGWRLPAAAFACCILAFAAAKAPALEGLPVFGYASAVLIIAAGSLFSPIALTAAAGSLRRVLPRRAPVLLALAALRTSRARFGVAMASLMVAVAMTVAIATLVTSFRTTVAAWAGEALQADLYVGMPGAVDASSQGYFSEGTVARLKRLAGIAGVDTYRGFPIPFRGRIVQLGASDFSTMGARPKLRLLGNADIGAVAKAVRTTASAVVSDAFVNRFGVHPGDAIEIATPSGPARLTIAAEYNDYSTSEGTILMDRSLFSRLFHDRAVDSIAVYVRPGTTLAAARARIVRGLAPLAVNVSTNRELRGFVLQVFDHTFAITSALYTIAIAVAVLGVITTFVALVLERRVEFALMRYVGLRVRELRELILVQAGVVGLLAGVLGVAVGVALAFVLIFVINRQSFGWLIELRVPWLSYLEAVALVTAGALAASFIPSSVAARIRASEALRSE